MVIKIPICGKATRGRGRPRQSDEVLSRQGMLQRAFTAFAQDSYDAVSMRQLAAACGLSNTLLHHHFGTKEALWREATDTVCEPIVARLMAELESPESFPETLRSLISISLRMTMSQRLALTLMFREGELDNSRGEYLRVRFCQPFFDRLNPLLASGREAGLLADIPEVGVNVMISGIMRYMLIPGMLQTALEPHLATEEAREAFTHAMVNSALYGILRRPAQS